MKLKRFFKLINPFPKTTYSSGNGKRFFGKTGTGWARHRRRIKKVFPVFQYKENIIDFLTQYPFNKYGWTDFRYWFKYRFQKKHQYHKLDLGLKPGYYELDIIFEKAIGNQRVYEIFDDVYSNWYRYKDEISEDGTPVYRREFSKDMRELKRAIEWLRKGTQKIDRKVEKIRSGLSKKPSDIGLLEYFDHMNDEDSKIYRKISDLENRQYNKTTWALTVVVKNRGVLWT